MWFLIMILPFIVAIVGGVLIGSYFGTKLADKHNRRDAEK